MTTETDALPLLIGLSKERPILDHHAKAHIHEIRRISCGFHLKSTRFHEIHRISKDQQLPGMVRPMFFSLFMGTIHNVWVHKWTHINDHTLHLTKCEMFKTNTRRWRIVGRGSEWMLLNEYVGSFTGDKITNTSRIPRQPQLQKSI